MRLSMAVLPAKARRSCKEVDGGGPFLAGPEHPEKTKAPTKWESGPELMSELNWTAIVADYPQSANSTEVPPGRAGFKKELFGQTP